MLKKKYFELNDKHYNACHRKYLKEVNKSQWVHFQIVYINIYFDHQILKMDSEMRDKKQTKVSNKKKTEEETSDSSDSISSTEAIPKK